MRWIVVLVALQLWPAMIATAAGPKLSMGENATLRLPVGSTGGPGRVLLRAEELGEQPDPSKLEVGITDLGGLDSGSTVVTFASPAVEAARGTTSRAWLVTAQVKDLPLNAVQKRFARLKVGNAEQQVEYLVTNQSPATFTWAVAAPPSPWLVWHGFWSTRATTALTVTTGDAPATNVRLAQASLRETLGTAEFGVEDLELCEEPNGPCGRFSIAARTTRTLYLRLKSNEWTRGKYTGTLSFAVDERPELQTVNATIQASSWPVMLIGALLLLAGIYVAWWNSAWARVRIQRLEALKPVALLRQSVAAVRKDLEARPEPAPDPVDARERLAAIDAALTERELDDHGCLPPAFPAAYGSISDTAAKLKEYLEARGKILAAVAVIVRDGMRVLWAEHTPKPAPEVEELLDKSLGALDALAATTTSAEQAKPEVDKILAAYTAAKAKALKIAADAQALDRAPWLLAEVNEEIARLQSRGWLLWGAVTFLAGFGILILRDPGFGTSIDLLFCLFWGLGLPTAGEKLQQATPGTIASSIGVSLPKVT